MLSMDFHQALSRSVEAEHRAESDKGIHVSIALISALLEGCEVLTYFDPAVLGGDVLHWWTLSK